MTTKIFVYRLTTDRILPQAFSFHTEVRHVQVEAGIRIVGEAAWRSCQQLQVVHLPDTVVCLRHGVFRRCHLLRAVTAPGRRQFGIKVFEACCSLTQIGATQHSDNQLAPQAQFRLRAFEKCTTLRHLNMEQTEYDPANPNRTAGGLRPTVPALHSEAGFCRLRATSRIL